jgi:imidazolonepropionase-like amidohydrolase
MEIDMLRNTTVFNNVKIFDGRSNHLSELSQVIVSDNMIVSVRQEPILPDEQLNGAYVIDGRGRTLMPGLIDAHWHAMFAEASSESITTADAGYVQLAAASAASKTLMRGFTTVRDAGGPVFGLKRAIDEGLAVGPRIYPSGAFISQTGGHGDFRTRHDVLHGGTAKSHIERTGVSAIADGVTSVARAAREQLMMGASQLKIMAGGGVSSAYDPIDVTQYTRDEMVAAVSAAENWGTYVMAHAFTPHSVQRAIDAGVRCIEHGHNLDRATVEAMADRDVWWSLQPLLDDEDARALTGDARTKQMMVLDATDTAYELARTCDVSVAWGTDVLFDSRLAARQGAQLTKMVRWYQAHEVLTMATSSNARLLALSGLRNPYLGRLGVIEPGALADLLLIDGDPLADIEILNRPETAMVVIMKDGKIFKNRVDIPEA